MNQRVVDFFSRKIALEFHYYAIPPEKWAEKLQNLQSRQITSIILSIPWAWHELNEYGYDFTSPGHDLPDLLQLCNEYQIDVIIRCGPRVPFYKPFRGIPAWLYDKYPEIVDKNANGESAWQDFDTPAINVLHPTYLEKVQKWWHILLDVLKQFTYPQGRIILVQLDSHTGLESLHEPYFTFGYHSQLLDLYQGWLKNKYQILSTVNAIYRTEYSDLSQIRPPPTPLAPQPNKHLPVAVYLDWLEFKEEISAQYLVNLGDMINSAEIKIPLLVSLNSYKSPVNSGYIRTLLKDDLLDQPLLMGYEFHPGVFTASVNCHCYVNFHVEWMKDHLPNHPFLSNVQASHFNSEWNPIQLHNLLRMSLSHGARSFLVRMPLPQINEKLADPVEKVRDTMLTEFAQILRIFPSGLKKTYDPLSVAYYHPVTRFKSFDSPINSESFGFPIQYATLKYYYKYILQLLTKFFVQYDVIDLQAITPDALQLKPFIMLYYIGWMEHSIMVKLQDYVKQGGIIISFGDIPQKNAFFEEDLTLHEIYQARCEGEHAPDTPLRWTGIAPFENLSVVKYLCSYALEDPDHTNILADNLADHQTQDLADKLRQHPAQKEEDHRIFAFSRRVDQGLIIHSGILVSSDFSSVTFLQALLEEAKFPNRNMSVSQECVAIQQVAPSEEGLLLVGNLQEKSLKNLSFSFYNPRAQQYPGLLEINDISLPPHIFHLWHAHKTITQNIQLIYITAEIYSITENPCQIRARYYALDEFRMVLRIPPPPSSFSFSSSSSSIRIISGEGEVSEKMQKNGKYTEISIKSSTHIQFKVDPGPGLGEVVVFSIEKKIIP
ncbi:MAG: beta-galactosidase [Promethearchaeota archaeon]